MKSSLLLLFVFLYTHSYAQNSIYKIEDRSALNQDFEQVSADNTPTRWFLSEEKKYQYFLDSTIAFSGKRSLRITRLTQGSEVESRNGSAYIGLPIDDVRGKKITLHGYIRTADLTSGSAVLWVAVIGPSGLLAIDTMGGRGAKGTTEWKQYMAELYVDSTATSVSIGVGQNSSKGSAWFDKLEILLDSKPYEPKLFALNDDQVDWLKQAAHPFKTSKAESGFEDLTSIKEIVGSAEIVGLGEATHGTKEFSEMKHRLVEYLTTNSGFTIFSVEAGMPEAHKINDYIQGGHGNLRNLMKELFYGLNTKEFEALLEWMRKYNTSGKGYIEFTGFDMQDLNAPASNVIEFLKQHDPDYAITVRKNYDSLRSYIEAIYTMPAGQGKIKLAASANDALLVFRHMQAANYQKSTSQKEIDWAIQNANVVVQAAYMGLHDDNYSSSYYRDSCMSENIRWIKDHAQSGAKLILWAHNGHVAKSDGWRMGVHLDRIYGKKYRAIGFKFNEGTYTAWSGNALSSSNVAMPSDPGTLDWIFHSLGMPRFILDMQNTSASDPRSGWLHKKLETKDIGGAAEQGYIFQKAAERWDAIIFFDKTSSIECYGY